MAASTSSKASSTIKSVIDRVTGNSKEKAVKTVNMNDDELFQGNDTSEDQKEEKPQQVAPKTKPLIAIIYHSVYNHIRTLTDSLEAGVKAAGCDVKVYQVQEILSKEVLKKMYGVDQDLYAEKHPIITHEKLIELANVDGFLFGFPTRFGMMSASMKAFWDSTGGIWQKGLWVGKPAGFYSASGSQGSIPQTILTAVTQLANHGMVYVPLGGSSQALFKMELHGGGPLGAGTLAGADGKRQPSDLEKEIAHHQGKHTAEFVKRLWRGSNM